ncbi:MAG TPA: 2-hydroxyacyl-CoA dehydratase family protein [Syntrophales bacterium]|nr:2-hydroxyacyl-CoA dehydratase family protein [Syntrophales bacterium]
MDPLAEFRAAVADPASYVRSATAQSGKKAVGTLCSYAPEELIYAAGAHPVRLFGTSGAERLADRHLQSYCCSLVRGVLEDALAGRSDFLAGVVFPHTCDSIQRLSDLWRLNVPGAFHIDAVLPARLDTASARDYLLDVLRRFRSDLERKLRVSISDESLRRAIDLYNRIREMLARLYELRNENPCGIRGRDVHTIVKASTILDRDRLVVVLPPALQALEDVHECTAGNKAKRVLLAGGLCDHPELYSFIEEAGGVVVWDDFCTGTRGFSGTIDGDGDPLAAIAQRYAERPVCPAKHRGIRERAEHLVRLAKEKEARGVVFLLVKFCDPHAFDYPYLKEALDGAGIPSMLFEMEDQLPAEGQLRTRFEAFLEMI